MGHWWRWWVIVMDWDFDGSHWMCLVVRPHSASASIPVYSETFWSRPAFADVASAVSRDIGLKNAIENDEALEMLRVSLVTEWLRPRSGRHVFWIVWRMWCRTLTYQLVNRQGRKPRQHVTVELAKARPRTYWKLAKTCSHPKHENMTWTAHPSK